MCIKTGLFASLLFAALSSQAQTFTNLYDFTGGGDGGTLWSGLVLSQNTLYGTTYSGGSAVEGTIFSVNTDGSGFTNLHQFTSGIDGANPYAGMILSGNTLYGTAFAGGASGNGVVFSMRTDGSGFTTVYSFTGGSGGAGPWGGVVLSGNTLYGTTEVGGSGSLGTVFAVNTDGTGFKILHNFVGGANDGGTPYAGLVLSGGTLYGTTQVGGTAGNGMVYGVNTDGTGFTNLHSFTTTSGAAQVNNDGAEPWAGLVLSGNTLYGAAYSGGSQGNGTLFSVNTDGSSFTVLHTFSALAGTPLANIDGGNPVGGLIVSGNTLYGTGQVGGVYGSGTVFSLNTDGTGFATLYNFSQLTALNMPNADGAFPVATLFLSGTTLYGTAFTGGASGYGSVFRLSVPAAPPRLTITSAGTNFVLTWPTNATGFILQSTTNLNSSTNWSTVAPLPVIVNGQNTVTNRVSGAQQFYRLSH